MALRERLEAANGAVYAAIRDEVRRGVGRGVFAQVDRAVRRCWSAAAGAWLRPSDELIAGVLGLHEPVSEAVLTPEMVFYQPTPARHILEMIRASGLGEDDVLIDLGSGLGHVAMLASILTGARAIGIEVDPAFVRCARECAAGLGLERVTFAEADARDADLSAGTVFHLYTPFTGGMLRSVLDRLRREADKRAIRVCTLGPCVEVVAKQSWLRAATVMDTDRMSCFVSREPSLRG